MTDDAGFVSMLGNVSVDDDGIHFTDTGDRPVDVLFDDQRIGSFWTGRDTVERDGSRTWQWPKTLRSHLNGTTTVAVLDHGSQQTLGQQRVSLGSGEGQVQVQDRQGNPLGLDKSNRLTRLFADRTAAHVEPLLDAIEQVLGVLSRSGVSPFLAYGTLLGAVREGALIGHDSDADLAYVSEFDHPMDAARESYRLQRAVVAEGFRVVRYSGLAFKVVITESDGSTRGLDVFGGLIVNGTLYLMGEVGAPFEPEWLLPTTTASLEGREYPVPARPEKLLEAMYGPSWKVPDPAYQFLTPRSTVRRLSGWFRGNQVRKDAVWDPWFRHNRPGKKVLPSEFVRWVYDREPGMTRAVEIGCGHGDDVLFLAEQGVTATGVDYARQAYVARARRAIRRGLPATYQWVSLTDLRSVIPFGVELSRQQGTVLLARHVLEATDEFGRENFLRLARSVLRGGGVLYLQVATGTTPESRPTGCRRIEPEQLAARLAAAGGTVLIREDVDEMHDELGAGQSRPVTRWVVQW